MGLLHSFYERDFLLCNHIFHGTYFTDTCHPDSNWLEDAKLH